MKQRFDFMYAVLMMPANVFVMMFIAWGIDGVFPSTLWYPLGFIGAIILSIVFGYDTPEYLKKGTKRNYV